MKQSLSQSSTLFNTANQVLPEQDGQGFVQIIDAYSSDKTVVNNAEILLKGEFVQTGSDLIIIGPDGSKVLIIGYFLHPSPPDLSSPGGSVLPPDLVEALAGSRTPGQYSQLGEDALESEPIGVVETAVGDVTVTRVSGEKVALNQGSPVFQGDILETSTDSALGITFADSSTFSLGDEGRIVLDEMVYDPVTQEGSSVFSVVQGVFLFVSGEIAAENPDGMIVRTPVATLGIRGTKVAGKAAQEGDMNTITLMPDNDGSVGQIVVSNPTGSVTLETAFQTTAVSSTFLAPAQAITLSEQQAGSLFGGVDRVLQNNAPLNTQNNTNENRQASPETISQTENQSAPQTSENLSGEETSQDLNAEGLIGEEEIPGEFGPDGPGEFGPDGPGEFGPDGPGEFGPDGPGEFGPDGQGEFGPEGQGELGAEGTGEFGPDGPGEEDAIYDAAWDAFEGAIDEGQSLADAANSAEGAAKDLAVEIFGSDFDEDIFNSQFTEALGEFGPEGPGEFGPEGPGEFGPDGQGEFGPDGQGELGAEGPGEFGPEGPGEFGPEGPGEFGPEGPGEFGPEGPGEFGPEGKEGPGEFGPGGPGDSGNFGDPGGPNSLFVSSGPIYGDWGGYGPVAQQNYDEKPIWLDPPDIGIGKTPWGGGGYVVEDPGFIGFNPFFGGLGSLFNPFGAGFDSFNVFIDPTINDNFFFGPQKGAVPLLETPLGNIQQLANTDTAVDGPVLTGLGVLLHQSGTASFTFSQAGTVFVGAGVVNDTDNAVPSGLLIDNIQKNGNVEIGFESGSLEGLSFLGNVAVVGTSGSIAPTEGNFQAFLLAGSAPISAIESFLGIDLGSLSFSGAVNPTFGSAIGAFVDVVPGDTITYDFDFLDAESAGGNAFNFFKDFAFASFGEDGVDNIVGGAGADVLNGTNANEVFAGGAGADTINGGAGNDTIAGGTGADTLDGGAGNDTASFFDLSTGVTASLAAGSASSGGDTDTLQNFENLLGTGSGDILTGDSNANTLDGSGGIDTINGGGGNDVLIGGPGADTLIGGSGIDTVSFASEGAATISLSGGSAVVGNVADVITQVENVDGSIFVDTITGDSGANIIQGGAGSDILTGGGGADTFLYGSPGDSAEINQNVALEATILSTSGIDKINDFVSGTDKIALGSAFGITSITNNQNFFTVSSYNGTNSGASANVDHLIFDTTKDILIYDNNSASAGYTILADTNGVNVISSDISIV